MRRAIALLLLLATSCATVPRQITRDDRCWKITSRSTTWSAIGAGSGLLAGGATALSGRVEGDEVRDEVLRWSLLIGGIVFAGISVAAFDVRDSSAKLEPTFCDDGDVSPAEFPETAEPVITSSTSGPPLAR